MHRSESIAQLAAALAVAQGKFPRIPRDRTVTVRSKKTDTTYTFSYAPLDTILDAVRPQLAANGLALVQGVVMDDKGAEYVRTTLLHSSGEWLAHDQPLFSGSADNASQAYASGMTYSRRYGVQALLCLAADDDDDGGGNDEGQRRPQQRPQGKAAPKPAAKPQQREPQATPEAQPASDDGGEPGIHGLSAGMEKVLMAKATGVGMDRDTLVRTFGSITPANINHVLGQLKPTGGA
jgi:hypothetical protein